MLINDLYFDGIFIRNLGKKIMENSYGPIEVDAFTIIESPKHKHFKFKLYLVKNNEVCFIGHTSSLNEDVYNKYNTIEDHFDFRIRNEIDVLYYDISKTLIETGAPSEIINSYKFELFKRLNNNPEDAFIKSIIEYAEKYTLYSNENEIYTYIPVGKYFITRDCNNNLLILNKKLKLLFKNHASNIIYYFYEGYLYIQAVDRKYCRSYNDKSLKRRWNIGRRNLMKVEISNLNNLINNYKRNFPNNAIPKIRIVG